MNEPKKLIFAYNSDRREYFRINPLGRNQEQPPPSGDDRDSFSSISAVINSESQVDTAVIKNQLFRFPMQ
jgi:hypothetical protein